MKARLIRIGNSRGVRLPKALLEQCGLEDEIVIEIEDGRLVLRPAGAPRVGWRQAFEEMTETGDDRLIGEEAPTLTSWDDEEWEW